jgi:hypothetical protein
VCWTNARPAIENRAVGITDGDTITLLGAENRG